MRINPLEIDTVNHGAKRYDIQSCFPFNNDPKTGASNAH